MPCRAVIFGYFYWCFDEFYKINGEVRRFLLEYQVYFFDDIQVHQ